METYFEWVFMHKLLKGVKGCHGAHQEEINRPDKKKFSNSPITD